MKRILPILSIIFTFILIPPAHANNCIKPYLLPSSDQTKRIGTYNVQILFVKFADSGKKTKNDIKQHLSFIDLKEMNNYIKQTSYSKTKLKFNIENSWITLPGNSYDYGLQFSMSEEQENNYRDAIYNAATEKIDFSKSDAVWVIPDPSLSQYYIAFRNPLIADGKKMMMVMYNETNAYLAVSEILHTLGLRDLYSQVSIYGPGGGMEQFSIMSQYNGGTSILGYEKLALGWLSNKDYICHENGSINVKLNSLDSKGLKLILVPINAQELVGIEYRKKEKTDKYLGSSGVLVYHVNNTLIDTPAHVSPINPIYFGNKKSLEFSGIKINIKKNNLNVIK